VVEIMMDLKFDMREGTPTERLKGMFNKALAMKERKGSKGEFKHVLSVLCR
jgi:hypothetical protein